MSTCFAQTGIKGVLFEKGTRNVLAQTNVFIMPHKLKATTDSKGRFLFPDVPKGKFNFIVNKSNYLRIDIESTKNETNYELRIIPRKRIL